MKRLLLIATALLAATAANAAERTERDMTCRGPLEGPKDYRAIMIADRSCYFTNPAVLEIVNGGCQAEMPCVVRAHVAPRDTPEGMPPSWTVRRVYSATADVPLPRKRPRPAL